MRPDRRNAGKDSGKVFKKGEIYKALDGETLRIVSSDELEDAGGNIGKYTVEGDKVRVVLTADGGAKASYLQITGEGFVEEQSGSRKILYSSANYDVAVRRAEEERIKLEREAAREAEEARQKVAARGEEAGKGAMVSVKGGCFEMGDTFGDYQPVYGMSNEKPIHKVCLDDFKMDKYEVTQAAYQAAMGNNPSHYKNCPNCPVERVIWDEAKEFCGKVGKRLPSEAEWEYAAREEGKKVKYGTGKNEINQGEANYKGHSTKPVGSYPPNAMGLYDMAGNVLEWTGDWYDEEYYKNSPEKNPKGPEDKPKGPEAFTYRVLRGGAWDDRSIRLSRQSLTDDAHYVRASCRTIGYWYGLDKQNDSVGFRCAQ
jgi:formylglycine-generating enzyme required for sulfatase activity